MLGIVMVSWTGGPSPSQTRARRVARTCRRPTVYAVGSTPAPWRSGYAAACKAVYTSSILVGASSPDRPRAGSLTDQVVALGDVRGEVGGFGVRLGCGGQVAVELVQVPARGVPAMPFADHLAQPVRLAQPGGRTEDMADRDRAAQHRGGVLADGVVAQRDEVVVPGEDLRPVGLL